MTLGPPLSPWKHSSLERHALGRAHSRGSEGTLNSQGGQGKQNVEHFHHCLPALLLPGERHTSFLHLFLSEYGIHNSLEGCWHSCPVPRAAFWNPNLVPKSMAEGKCPLAACAAFPWSKGHTHSASSCSARYQKMPLYTRSWAAACLQCEDVKEPFQCFIFLL